MNSSEAMNLLCWGSQSEPRFYSCGWGPCIFGSGSARSAFLWLGSLHLRIRRCAKRTIAAEDPYEHLTPEEIRMTVNVFIDEFTERGEMTEAGRSPAIRCGPFGATLRTQGRVAYEKYKEEHNIASNETLEMLKFYIANPKPILLPMAPLWGALLPMMRARTCHKGTWPPSGASQRDTIDELLVQSFFPI